MKQLIGRRNIIRMGLNEIPNFIFMNLNNILNKKNINVLKKAIKEKNKNRSKPGLFFYRDWVDTRIKIDINETSIYISIPNNNRTIQNQYQNLVTPERAHLYADRGDVSCKIISKKDFLVKTHIIDNKNHSHFNEKKLNVNKPDQILDYILNQVNKVEKMGYGTDRLK